MRPINNKQGLKLIGGPTSTPVSITHQMHVVDLQDLSFLSPPDVI